MVRRLIVDFCAHGCRHESDQSHIDSGASGVNDRCLFSLSVLPPDKPYAAAVYMSAQSHHLDTPFVRRYGAPMGDYMHMGKEREDTPSYSFYPDFDYPVSR